MAGGSAGAFTKTCVAPLERAKILLQVQGISCEKGTKIYPSQLKYRGLFGTMLKVVREEGIFALYRGNGANVLRVIPVYALKFTFNDFFVDLVKKDTSKDKLEFYELILSGTMAGLFQTCITYPLETVRTRLSAGRALGANYSGIADVFSSIIKTEGFRGFYKGMFPTFLTGSPYVGLQMASYEVLLRNQSFIKNQIKHSCSNTYLELFDNMYTLTCGAVAGITAQAITYPGDTVRRRMQTNGMLGKPKVYSSSLDCLRKIINHEGFSKLYAGLSANLIRAIPGAAIQFWAYDKSKTLLGIRKKS